jgi:putative hemolysin
VKTIMLTLLLCSPLALASEVKESWSIGHTAIEFVQVPPRGFLLNTSCYHSKEKCQAYRETLKSEPLVIGNDGGKNPASAVCKKRGGSVVIAMSAIDETQGFCVFPDKSMASLDAF